MIISQRKPISSNSHFIQRVITQLLSSDFDLIMKNVFLHFSVKFCSDVVSEYDLLLFYVWFGFDYGDGFVICLGRLVGYILFN